METLATSRHSRQNEDNRDVGNTAISIEINGNIGPGSLETQPISRPSHPAVNTPCHIIISLVLRIPKIYFIAELSLNLKIENTLKVANRSHKASIISPCKAALELTSVDPSFPTDQSRLRFQDVYSLAPKQLITSILISIEVPPFTPRVWEGCTVPFTVQPFAYTSCTSRLRAPQGSHRMGDQWHQL